MAASCWTDRCLKNVKERLRHENYCTPPAGPPYSFRKKESRTGQQLMGLSTESIRLREELDTRTWAPPQTDHRLMMVKLWKISRRNVILSVYNPLIILHMCSLPDTSWSPVEGQSGWAGWEREDDRESQKKMPFFKWKMQHSALSRFTMGTLHALIFLPSRRQQKLSSFS